MISRTESICTVTDYTLSTTQYHYIDKQYVLNRVILT